MAIALAEADKYEVLERIGKAMIVCISLSAQSNLASRLRFLWNHSEGQTQDRWIRKSYFCGRTQRINS